MLTEIFVDKKTARDKNNSVERKGEIKMKTEIEKKSAPLTDFVMVSNNETLEVVPFQDDSTIKLSDLENKPFVALKGNYSMQNGTYGVYAIVNILMQDGKHFSQPRELFLSLESSKGQSYKDRNSLFEQLKKQNVGIITVTKKGDYYKIIPIQSSLPF